MNEEIKWPKITKDTPMPEIKRIHQMIWNYAIEHGVKPKVQHHSDCVACEYIWVHHRTCSECPIVWPKNEDGIHHCIGVGGLYDRWHYAEDDEKTALAKQIRDLPWKYELEEKTPP